MYHWMMNLATNPTMPNARPRKITKVSEFAGLGFPGQVANDEQHVEHEAAHPKGEAKAGNLFF